MPQSNTQLLMNLCVYGRILQFSKNTDESTLLGRGRASRPSRKDVVDRDSCRVFRRETRGAGAAVRRAPVAGEIQKKALVRPRHQKTNFGVTRRD